MCITLVIRLLDGIESQWRPLIKVFSLNKMIAKNLPKSELKTGNTVSSRRDVLRVLIGGFMATSSFSYDAHATASSSSMASRSPIIGRYNDPSHPGCRREIDEQGNVFGADPVPIRPKAPCLKGEKVDPWQLTSVLGDDGLSIMIDFDPIDVVKQGPVEGKWTGEGLQLPNGLWTKLKS